MDVYASKRPVGGNSAPKKRSVAAVKDTASSRDGAAQFCNRLGCCGRLNSSKGTKNKCLEKPNSLKPSLHSSSSKEVSASSSKNYSSITNANKSTENSAKNASSKIKTNATGSKSNSVRNESEFQELNASKSHTQLKLKSRTLISDQNNDSNNGRGKRFIQGESSSSSGKGKRVIGVSPNEGRVSDPRNSRNLTSCRTGGVLSVRTRRSLNLDISAGSINQQSSNVKLDMSPTQESSPDVNDNGTRHYNIDGIADVLLALDRIEHDQELSYEQLMSLEANLFLGGLNFYDQHRDMRLDIDNMSYEELLVLEEKMGTVSTALSEEELLKCIKTSVYESLPLEDGKMRRSSGADDSKCSICQEEFVRGDEIGRLGCGHGYHSSCINQWLGLKNWCPICKAAPEP